jgi:L-iditol 2-dehydrogenase
MKNYESKCLVYYGPGDIKTEKWQLSCGSKDIMLKVDVCGRCGTDKRLYNKAHSRVKTPTILGHELVGTVVEVGSEVNTLTRGIGYLEGKTITPKRLLPAIGSRVTVQGRAARHSKGLMLMAEPIQNLTFWIPGAYAQYMKVPAEMIQSGTVIALPDSIGDEAGALVEPAGCALESIFATPHPAGVDKEGRHLFQGGIKKGGRTLILGSGTLAMIYGRLAALEGAGEIWYIVRSEYKKKLLETILGPGHKVKIVEDYSELLLEEKITRESQIEQEYTELTGGDLFDDVILACPSPDAQRLMFQLLNPNGYGVAVCFAGLHERSEAAQVDLLHYRLGKASGTSGCSTRAMETIINWLADGKLSLKGLSSPRHYTFADDPADFFQTPADGRKPMLYPWE